MQITPNATTVKWLFEQKHTFQVPKYQRGYAWNDDAVKQFINDVKECLNARSSGKPRHHFFGGIVVVKKNIPGSSRHNFEIIDGQQRLASFVMLVATVIKSMQDLAKNNNLNKKEKKSLELKINKLKSLYVTYRDKEHEVPKLILSRSDKIFFQDIIDRKISKIERESHKYIKNAWCLLSNFIIDMVSSKSSISEKIKFFNLLIDEVLSEDCALLLMESETLSESYKIFLVLNSRGVHLTAGDLLRVRTMEFIDRNSTSNVQNELSSCWDKILEYPLKDVGNYLKWYFSSYKGSRPKSPTSPSKVADQFMEFRFKYKRGTFANKKEVKAILDEAKNIDRDFKKLKMFEIAHWPYDKLSKKVKDWDRKRLEMLVVHLKQTNVMPLLLSLSLLDEGGFSEAVAIIERFIFRYKAIGKMHITKMQKLYFEYSTKIRSVRSLNIGDFRRSFGDLILEEIEDNEFKIKLNALRYSTSFGNGLYSLHAHHS